MSKVPPASGIAASRTALHQPWKWQLHFVFFPWLHCKEMGWMRRTRRDRLKYPRDGSFETILRIFLIWEQKRLKLVFETETWMSWKQGRDGQETDETVSRPRDRRLCIHGFFIYHTQAKCFLETCNLTKKSKEHTSLRIEANKGPISSPHFPPRSTQKDRPATREDKIQMQI